MIYMDYITYNLLRHSPGDLLSAESTDSSPAASDTGSTRPRSRPTCASAAFPGRSRPSSSREASRNPTYLITGGSGRLVLRAKPGPAAKLLPSAHAVEREFRVISALGRAGFPAPRTHFLCEDEAIIGRAFYVMEYVEGRVLWEQSLPGMSPAERGADLR